MKKHIKLLFAALMLPVALSFLACGKTEVSQEETEVVAGEEKFKAEDLVGTWKGKGSEISTITFGANGSYLDDAGDLYIKGTYTVDPVAGTVTVSEEEYGLVFVYDAELTGDLLTLQISGGKQRIFGRE